MFSSKKLLKKVCMLLVTSMTLSCFCPAVNAAAPGPNTAGTLETTPSINVAKGDAVTLTVNVNESPKYDNGLPIQLVNSVLPSQYDVAVYLRVTKEDNSPVTPWIKVWDNFLLTDRLKYVSVTDVSSTYKIYSYIDGKGNYDDVTGS